MYMPIMSHHWRNPQMITWTDLLTADISLFDISIWIVYHCIQDFTLQPCQAVPSTKAAHWYDNHCMHLSAFIEEHTKEIDKSHYVLWSVSLSFPVTSTIHPAPPLINHSCASTPLPLGLWSRHKAAGVSYYNIHQSSGRESLVVL